MMITLEFNLKNISKEKQFDKKIYSDLLNLVYFVRFCTTVGNTLKQCYRPPKVTHTHTSKISN